MTPSGLGSVSARRCRQSSRWLQKACSVRSPPKIRRDSSQMQVAIVASMTPACRHLLVVARSTASFASGDVCGSRLIGRLRTGRERWLVALDINRGEQVLLACRFSGTQPFNLTRPPPLQIDEDQRDNNKAECHSDQASFRPVIATAKQDAPSVILLHE